MSRHSFDPQIAKDVGLNAAIIFQNIGFWCERNAIKERNVYDGNAWTFNSITSFGKLFPYLSQKQIRTALDKLVECGLLSVGNYNKDNRDRTKWYALSEGTEAFALLVSPHLPLRADCFAPEGRPLPDSKPDIKQTPIPPEGADLFSEQDQDEPEADDGPDAIDQGFTEFWGDWPRHSRKAGKSDCSKVYRAACEGKHKKADGKIDPQVLNRAARAYVASLRGDLTYLKGTLPWLRQPGWEPFLDVAQKTEVIPFTDLTLSQQSALREGRVPPSMMENDKPNVTAAHWLKVFEGRKS